MFSGGMGSTRLQVIQPGDTLHGALRPSIVTMDAGDLRTELQTHALAYATQRVWFRCQVTEGTP